MDLAVGCDTGISGEHGRLHARFGRRNAVPESGGSWYLARLAGGAKAAGIAFLSKALTAGEALAYGLANKVVPHEELMPEARRWAAQIATGARLAIQATSRIMPLGLDESFETVVGHTMLQLVPLFGREEFKEDIAAFAECRDPTFLGR